MQIPTHTRADKSPADFLRQKWYYGTFYDRFRGRCNFNLIKIALVEIMLQDGWGLYRCKCKFPTHSAFDTNEHVVEHFVSYTPSVDGSSVCRTPPRTLRNKSEFEHLVVNESVNETRDANIIEIY